MKEMVCKTCGKTFTHDRKKAYCEPACRWSMSREYFRERARKAARESGRTPQYVIEAQNEVFHALKKSSLSNMIAAGYTMPQMAELMCISRQRVHQMLQKCGLSEEYKTSPQYNKKMCWR